MNTDQKVGKDQIREYFDDASLPDFGVDSRFFPAMGRELVKLAGILPGYRVLDVATGLGASLFPAAERAGDTGEVIGVDLAHKMVAATANEIHRRRISNASIYLMDAEQLPFQNGYFDRVLCGFALFFMPHLHRTVSEFYRVLRPGGVSVASTFGKNDEQYDWYEDLLLKYGVTRKIPITQSLEDSEELTAEFSNAGFSQIQVSNHVFDCVYEDPEDWWSHLWSTADRIGLEALSAKERNSLRKEAFAHVRELENGGKIRIAYHVLFTLATK